MAFYFMCIIFVLGLGIMFYNICGTVYTWSNHCGWEENSNPDKNAKIQNMTSERVQYGRTYANLKTKVSFSDGFYFITYKNDRETRILTYKIYLSDKHRKKIIDLAIEKHNSAIDKFLSQK